MRCVIKNQRKRSLRRLPRIIYMYGIRRIGIVAYVANR